MVDMGGKKSMRKYGISMNMPEGKMAGFYAQVVKALAGAVQLFDRDKDLLIVSSEADKHAVIEVMHRFKFVYEEFNLLLLPEPLRLFPAFTDYGFASRGERHYLYEELVSVFQFAEDQPQQAEPEQALLQMEEHLLARFSLNGKPYYTVDKQLLELMEKIASAYKCKLQAVE
jgi:hypothetical protein